MLQKVNPETEFRAEMIEERFDEYRTLKEVVGEVTDLKFNGTVRFRDVVAPYQLIWSAEDVHGNKDGKNLILDILKKNFPRGWEIAVSSFCDLNFTQCKLCKEWWDYSSLEESDRRPIDKDGLCFECHDNTNPIKPGDLSDQMYDQARDDEAMAEARLEASSIFAAPECMYSFEDTIDTAAEEL